MLGFELLPDLPIQQIAAWLGVDDLLNFMEVSGHVHSTLKHGFRRYTHIQASDDPQDNYLQARESSSCEHHSFHPCKLASLLQLCTQLTSVVILVKSPPKHHRYPPTTTCALFDTTMYRKGGYLGRFCWLADRSAARLRSISLNIDLVVPCFSQLHLPCPVEDLRFAVRHLLHRPVQVFIQIGFCSSNYAEGDSNASGMLLNAMYRLRQEMQQTYDCAAVIDLGVDEGYVDLTVEKDNLEYSFAFFYYNPDMCELEPASVGSHSPTALLVDGQEAVESSSRPRLALHSAICKQDIC